MELWPKACQNFFLPLYDWVMQKRRLPFPRMSFLGQRLFIFRHFVELFLATVYVYLREPSDARCDTEEPSTSWMSINSCITTPQTKERTAELGGASFRNISTAQMNTRRNGHSSQWTQLQLWSHSHASPSRVWGWHNARVRVETMPPNLSWENTQVVQERSRVEIQHCHIGFRLHVHKSVLSLPFLKRRVYWKYWSLQFQGKHPSVVSVPLSSQKCWQNTCFHLLVWKQQVGDTHEQQLRVVTFDLLLRWKILSRQMNRFVSCWSNAPKSNTKRRGASNYFQCLCFCRLNNSVSL